MKLMCWLFGHQYMQVEMKSGNTHLLCNRCPAYACIIYRGEQQERITYQQFTKAITQEDAMQSYKDLAGICANRPITKVLF